MIKAQIETIQDKLQSAKNIPSDTKAELLQLLVELETEVSLLSQTHGEEAQKIARSTHLSTEEITRLEKKPELMESALQELRESVVGFESSHPKMTGVVGQLATTLSNMGI